MATISEREIWIDAEMTNALDAGVFLDREDPELRAYAERGWEREIRQEEAIADAADGEVR